MGEWTGLVGSTLLVGYTHLWKGCWSLWGFACGLPVTREVLPESYSPPPSFLKRWFSSLLPPCHPLQQRSVAVTVPGGCITELEWVLDAVGTGLRRAVSI